MFGGARTCILVRCLGLLAVWAAAGPGDSRLGRGAGRGRRPVAGGRHMALRFAASPQRHPAWP